MLADEIFGFDDIDWLSRSGILVATNRPDWFVGNNNFVDILGAYFVKAASELAINRCASLAVFALKGGFADAENWSDAVANCGSNFLRDVGFGFVEDIATFGMTNDSVVYETSKLSEGDFASISAVIAPVEILGRKLELASIDLEGEGLKGNNAWREDDLDFAGRLNASAELVEIQAGFARGEVHFPVTDDVFFARGVHFVFPFV